MIALLLQIAIPAGLDAYLPAPPDNPIRREKVELGRKLFFDSRLSRDGKLSCSTCHDPARAFTDGHTRRDLRRAPRLINRAWGKSFFWDGRAASLEEQVLEPVRNPKEMDLPWEEAAARVGVAIPEMRQALASYVRTILSGDSPYDRYVAGDRAALDERQRLGLRLFRSKAGCAACHVGPNLTDERFHNTGVGGDPGRLAVTGREEDRGAFKTPGLREVARTPPYMHDGSLAVLADVIEFYDRGGKANPALDPEIRPLNLNAEEKSALEAFLRALNGTVRHGP